MVGEAPPLFASKGSPILSSWNSDKQAACFGRRWYQIDLGWYLIRGLQALRLASQVSPAKEVIKLRTLQNYQAQTAAAGETM